MIGIFDSGLGGLTILKALVTRFPEQPFIYYGDQANVPYGDRASEIIFDMTKRGVEDLFGRGCKLVVLGCNTATAVAARKLQREWLPGTGWSGHNVIGLVAPTVEAATQTPWAVTSPQYPQKYNTDLIAVFGTTRTVLSGVYPEEIRKRCPNVEVVQQICVDLAQAIESGADETRLDHLVSNCVTGLMDKTGGRPPHRAILGCTHYPLVEHLFRNHLPAFTRLLSQPDVVANSLEDYLARHPGYCADRPQAGVALLRLYTTGDPSRISAPARVFWPAVAYDFQAAS